MAEINWKPVILAPQLVILALHPVVELLGLGLALCLFHKLRRSRLAGYPLSVPTNLLWHFFP